MDIAAAPDWGLIFGLIVVATLISISAIPNYRHKKKTGKKLGRSTAAGGLGAFDEIFHPAAANAAVIIEEQREARTALPSPEDKDLDSLIADHASVKAKNGNNQRG